jgi:hypothetical protein
MGSPDVSEAWKNPAKRDCFFAAHDVNRVFFTYGRDRRLPDQKGALLNDFLYLCAELNGKPFSGLQNYFSFCEIPAETASAASR